MKIVSAEVIEGSSFYEIHTDLGETYERYAPDSWSQWFGESREAVWDSTRLEQIFQNYLREQKKPTEFGMDYYLQKVEYEIYKNTRIFEDLEMDGKISGNGHHIRQKWAKMAVEEVKKRWIG